MARVEGGRGVWWCLLAAIVSAGLVSRVTHTGFRLFDKYLGDALYAAMVYVLFRLTGRIARVTVWAAVTMTAIEFFQLTQIPAGMLRSRHLVIRACARLLGTEFSVLTSWPTLSGLRASSSSIVRSRPSVPGGNSPHKSELQRCRGAHPKKPASYVLLNPTSRRTWKAGDVAPVIAPLRKSIVYRITLCVKIEP
ncbi:MAG TPA: DUF2809 domain-containing protein [Bryobacteraceae bacterium]|jgi:hypothetical protein|nr:DUF2809 domain-containing protein [Bryobacteraceae bacterium]